MGVIYKTTNIINKKIYVGKREKDKETFLRSNYLGSGKILNLAIKKHGKENFIKEVLEEVNNNRNKKLLGEREIYWIDKLDARNPKIGYNIAIGGEGAAGYKQPESAKQKISKAQKGVPETEESRRINREAAKHRKKRIYTVSTEIRKQISEKLMNHPVSEECRRKNGQKHKELWEDKEYKNKMKLIHKIRISKMTDEERKHFGDAQRNIPRTEEVKAKISKKLKNHPTSEETKQKIRITKIGNKNVMKRPEVVAKRKETIKLKKHNEYLASIIDGE